MEEDALRRKRASSARREVLEYMIHTAGQLVALPRPHDLGIVATSRSITLMWQSLVRIYSRYIAIVEEQMFYNPFSQCLSLVFTSDNRALSNQTAMCPYLVI